MCASVHSISVYTTRFGEHGDGCFLLLFLHLSRKNPLSALKVSGPFT